ncbi:DUF1836 domain-containing protein [Oribacterium sinus]|jgi:hypothetical protein|uniref:DUF1836 domain-containing protein n=1 Tax=Oribacterium sinus TaxID=237576 RepID=UPI0028D5A46E|nr:DUF1836 domain-containing protein [Oribacterium sinus]
MDEQYLNELTEYLKSLHHVHAGSLPSLDLYMDQVTGFMEEHLASMKRHPEDKALTKTMINNYAKNKILPPPVGKRYNKNHMLILLLIYYYKSMLSLSDIRTVVDPLAENYFSLHSKPRLTDIYEEIFSFANGEMQSLVEDLEKKFQTANSSFSEQDPAFADLEEQEREQLQSFSFLSLLAFDVYLKKQLMEKIVDRMEESQKKRKRKKK